MASKLGYSEYSQNSDNTKQRKESNFLCSVAHFFGFSIDIYVIQGWMDATVQVNPFALIF